MVKKRLLLLGGGHTHALLIRQLAMKPIPGVQVMLVSAQSLAPYSGMLPGHLEGIYGHSEMHIDLVKLCGAAGVSFIQATACGIDKDQQKVVLVDRPSLSFDVLSINIGSLPEKEVWGIGIKPIHELLGQWSQIESASSIAIMGGGAGGVEVALSLQARFLGRKKISLFHRDPELLSQAPRGLRTKMAALCRERGIQLHLDHKDAATLAQSHDLVLWTTSARGPDMLRDSELALDPRGFLLTNEQLLCRGQTNIFAVGDCAHIQGQYRPRSGVYAVRLAQPLADNIRRYFRGEPLKKVDLQKSHLALLATGGREAILLRGGYYGPSKWIWKVKDRIDRGFMTKFQDLKPAPMMTVNEDPMRCLGCGAKVPGTILKTVLALLAKDYPAVLKDAVAIKDGEISSLESQSRKSQAFAMGEDVALVHGQDWMMQSLDYFPACLDDPFVLGKIACLHAAGDLIAKGGRPASGLVLAVLPHKAPLLLQDDLYQLLAGVASVLQTMGARLLGGHTAEGQQMAVGLHLQGPKPQGARWKPKSGLRVGDALILTKALGTGLILAGQMRQLTRGLWMERCVESMLLNHEKLIDLIADERVHGATDVTGFGLLGHLAEMVHASSVGVEIRRQDLPLLPGVNELLKLGVRSTLALDNENYAASLCTLSPLVDADLLCDPQTSGGLLLSVSTDDAEAWVTAAQEAGFSQCRIIGQVLPGPAGISIG